ncbi:Transmembrane protein 194A [Tupaia chinensis]|uniref:Transmembrane protein 194A n=1 Tax=Tupaia chinensis TaxID=246437 RepID=L8XZB0_TUPCH|nr:Transmembrane protein 194A [Tupaia chinensis]
MPGRPSLRPRTHIRINSSKLVRVAQVESEEKLKELEQFSIWNFFSSFLREKSNDTYVNVGPYSTKTCLKVEITEKDTKYSVMVTRSYVLTVGFMSFAVCYKYGPLENERSINLLTWTLQLMGLCFMYSAIQIPHIALAMIIIALCTKNLEYPIQWLYITYRFADFVEGSFHLTPNEVSVHEQEYGLGSIIDQDELFEETSSVEEDSDSQCPAITQNNILT